MIKEWLYLYRQYRKAKKLASDIEKAQFHALLALAYWKHCEEEVGIEFKVDPTGEYVRLGK